MAGLYLVTNLAFVVQRVTFDLQRGMPLEILNSLLDLACFAGLWILFAVPIIRLTDRRALTAGSIALYFAAGIGLSLLHGALYLLFTMSVPGLMDPGQIQSAEDYLLTLAGLGHAWRFLSFGFLVVVSHAYDYYVLSVEREKNAAQLRVQLTEARLEALRTQIRPHFLFNTLNAVTVLIDENPAAAKKTLAQLSELLRLTLENVSTQEVPLRREVEFLDHYLLIQQTRYGDRLSVRRAIGEEALDASVPYLVLQPLVENALKHGIDSLPGPGTITISARREGARLVLGVRDTGEGRRNAANGSQGMGIGLSNTSERLRQLYGDEHSVSIDPATDGNGTSVIVTLPFRVAPPAAAIATNGPAQ
jgi:hypothetical protein